MGKRRWLMLTVAVLLLIAAGLGIKSFVDRQAAKKRQAQYEAALGDYSGALKPGLSRREVESYFRLRGRPFRQICCIGVPRSGSAYADLIKIGQEKAPWYCNNYNIYVAFEFNTTEPGGSVAAARDSDRLVATTLYPWLEQCL